MSTLKEVRKARGLTQKDVADHLGISRQTYSGYENEQDRMTIGQAKSVCAMLKCEIIEVFAPAGADKN
ncbi:helix-turn-helix domain protein [Coriobacterium glomerans PW2]|uniref:Helix-turn-helix domain protein n=1 Tax=Coriobacterium glomerans (strain ATCC 49209 / DSM 20642 / JCM 10262 / PW2) TaxID=700015 RepID=F2NA46_CORGP|nr:helix-turn-helix transcriptional regulator [Coriobacterium glomerans]AEB06440.1 helix-turn-helix domain protein [Coriobacterium glomerans PW2]